MSRAIFEVDDHTRLVPLRRRDGSVTAWARVDEADYERVMAKSPWHRDSNGYARHVDWNHGDQVLTYLHRFVLRLGKGDLPVDHRDRDRLNDVKANLRLATPALNNQNLPGHGRSRYRGVTWHNNKWRARHILNGKEHLIGYYTDEDEAGRADAEWRAKNMPYSEEAA